MPKIRANSDRGIFLSWRMARNAPPIVTGLSVGFSKSLTVLFSFVVLIADPLNADKRNNADPERFFKLGFLEKQHSKSQILHNGILVRINLRDGT